MWPRQGVIKNTNDSRCCCRSGYNSHQTDTFVVGQYIRLRSAHRYLNKHYLLILRGGNRLIELRRAHTAGVWISGRLENSKRLGCFKKRTCHFTSGSAHSHRRPVLAHTQAQPHPTHQLSSHVKFTQCADRKTNSRVCCVRFGVRDARAVRVSVCAPVCLCCAPKVFF